MITVCLRQQGGAVVLTIPANFVKMLNLRIGEKLALEIKQETLILKALPKPSLKRYSLRELLEGATPENMAKLNEETAWAQAGTPMGRELI